MIFEFIDAYIPRFDPFTSINDGSLIARIKHPDSHYRNFTSHIFCTLGAKRSLRLSSSRYEAQKAGRS
jgi:hypothetical protein